MKRLIDANALKYDLGEIDDGLCKRTELYVTNEAIVKQPTVEAIPVEWIMRYAFDGERKRPISITKMIADWRKEHGVATRDTAERKTASRENKRSGNNAKTD